MPKILINISDELYQTCKNRHSDTDEIELAIANGAVLANNATNGDMLKVLFPNICITYDDEDMVVIDGFPASVVSNIEFDKAWWEAPYNGGL